MSAKQPAIFVENLVKSLDGREILRDVSLQVAQGETVAVLGESGGGKSMLLRHIMGLVKPDAGHIYINGVDITTLSDRKLDNARLQMGMLFQEAALFDSMDVFENVAFPLREHNRGNDEEIELRVSEYLMKVGLSDAAKLYPEQLSGGMKKRVGLARALVMRPEIMLYDEPTSGLDMVMRDEINALINNLNETFKVAALVVTHDIESALAVGDRLALLERGAIITQGTAQEVSDFDHPMAQKIGEWLKVEEERGG